jgi:hypothetical protein
MADNPVQSQPRQSSSTNDHAPAGVRDQVRRLAADTWGEPVRVLYLRRVCTKYRVPGRRDDGTPAGKHLFRRFFRNLARLPLLLVVFVIEAALDDTAADFGFVFGTFFRRGLAQGSSADAEAARVADVANRARRNVWLAWSDHHFAVVRAGGSGAPQLVCGQEGAASPRVKAYKQSRAGGHVTLRWRDHSALELPVDRRERRRFHEFDGLR